MAYFGCLSLVIPGIFWVLLWRGYDEIGPRWTLILAAGWLACFVLSKLIPGGPYFFISLEALTDIVLILVIYGGDLRIT